VEFWVHVVDTVLIFTILGLSLNLVLGFSGLASMAHAAFFGLGAYAAALLSLHLGWPFPLNLVAAVLITAAVAAVAALPALRVRGEYVILLTLALQMFAYGLMLSWVELTGGRTGLPGIPRPVLLGWKLVTPQDFLPLLLAAAAATFLVCRRIAGSPYGRVLKALREDEAATTALGKSVLVFRVSLFAVSGGLAGAAGGLFAHYHAFINPFSFSLDQSIFLIAVVTLGGTANLWGTTVGALLFVGVPELLRFLYLQQDIVAPMRNLIFGLLLVAFMRFRPQGIIPEYAGLERRLAGLKAESAPVGELFRSAARKLAATGLSRSFGGIQAVRAVDLELRPGEVVALVGPNGAGKTTVFNLLTGFLRPDAGRVYLNGEDITHLPPWQRARRGLVRTFQDVRVFQRMTVLDNVLVAVPNQSGENLLTLFFRPRRVAADENAARALAFGYLQFVGLADRAGVLAESLSFGEQKLLALARALAVRPMVVLLDEPASGVDPQWVERMLDLIRRLRDAGCTVGLVEHNLEAVRAVADRAYFLEAGQVVASGHPEELIRDRRLVEIYFGV
jgi:branched-chain amino acid transport system permease protein